MSRRIPHKSKSKPKTYAVKLETAAQSQTAKNRQMLFQMAHDAAAIAGNEYMGLANARLAEFLTVFSTTFVDIMTMIIEDGGSDRDLEYTKHKLDTRLAQILGEYFESWSKRYGGY